MVKNYCLTLLSLVFILSCSYGQGNLQFRRQLEKDPHTAIAFSVNNTEGTLERLLNDRLVRVKSVTPQWIYIQASPQWIADARQAGAIDGFYFEHSMPVALNDTSLVTHHVTEVHNGTNGLQMPFTGKDVIIGYVDQGLDYNHPDFIDSNGQTRVLFYWDHTLPNAPNTPLPYGYGQLWTQSEIQAGTCGSNEESTAHGTSVAGAGSSNARANGQQKGVAPDSKIIIVETNFDLPNWTLTVADACDFVFKKAEELGLPAVVNLSVGSYLGSHDGNDPAAELMEQLLEEQPGRIIVCAAGNSGAWGNYHVHDDVTSDTSFVWFLNNPSGAIAANSIYFDVWTDVSDAGWSYALAANKGSGTFEERAETVYRPASTGAGTGPILDTLYNGSNRIATIELYPEIVGNNLHIEVFVSQVDSTAYYYAFKTTGSGNYDAWSGTAMGLNAIVQTLPSSGVYPPIVHYNLPDAEQTVVSSWNCSEKMISVGNFRNRFGHTDKNGNYYQPAPSYTAEVGELSPNSSKGPTRHGVIKPDISACGDVSLSAGPMWVFSFPGANSVIDIDNWHVRNGGTSMASPVVAGIAALYLEKCNLGTYASFKSDLLSTAMTDGFTGAVPNNAYGYGKAHALNTLLASNFPATVSGPAQFCGSDTAYAITPGPLADILWNTGSENIYAPMMGGGSYFFAAYNSEGCISLSDTLTVVAGDIPPAPVITVNGTTLSTDPYPDLQWYENGIAMPGETGTSIVITLPNQNYYTVVATGTTGCEAESTPYNASAGVADQQAMQFTAWPNPSSGVLHIQSEYAIEELMLFDLSGNLVLSVLSPEATIDLKTLSLGTYLLHLRSESTVGWMKIVRN
jgi:hypothetical protein